MRALAQHSAAIAFAAIAPTIAILSGLGAWPGDLAVAIWFAGFTLAAVLAAFVDCRASSGIAPSTMSLAFVPVFGALLLLGPAAMTFTAAAAVLAERLVEPPRSQRRQGLLRVAAAIAAAQAAGAAYTLAGGPSAASFTWPSDGVPIALAVIAFSSVWIAAANVAAAASSGTRRVPSWRRVVGAWPLHLVAAAAAVGIVELITHQMWEIVPIAAVPGYFALRVYAGSAGRVDDEHRRRDSLTSLADGVAIVDRTGRIALWNHALGRMLECPARRAIGRSLADAAPQLARTAVGPAVEAAIQRGIFCPGLDVAIDAAHAARTLHVEILPDAAGVALLCRDVSERARAARAHERAADRLALAAAGANDGLWEWDLAAAQLYVSPRWRAAVGLTRGADIIRPEDWLERIHPDDRGRFDESLQAHLGGQTDRLHCEIRVRHADGAYRRFLCSGVAEADAGRARTRIAGSLTDLSQDSLALDLIRSAEFRDPLTGLANRAVFVKGLGQRLDGFRRSRKGRFAVLYLDLDRFKVVNDSLGHLVGDELLTAVSRRLESCLRTGDSLARLGGDEFAILLNDLGDVTQANAIAFRIQETLAAPFAIAGRQVVASASIGIAFCRAEYGNPEEMMRDADTAMYHAKAHGKARHELFDADMHARALDRLGFEDDLRQAIKRRAFELHYQPIVALASGCCAGFEALVRWSRHGHAVSPAQFIPVAEELGLIEELGTWVLQEACRAFAGWQQRFGARAPEYITVNVSTRQLMQQGFLDIVEQAVHDARLQPSDVRLEITETAVMDAPHLAAPVLSDLRDFGVKIYLDDFGTGYSSLSHLHRLPVDALKIDRSFVRSLALDDRPAIVESILALARTLQTAVVAEGVESEAQARELVRLGCTHAQGFHFSRPLTAAAVDELLSAGRPLGDRRPTIHAVPPRSRQTA